MWHYYYSDTSLNVWYGQTAPWKPCSDQIARIFNCLCPIDSARFLNTPQQSISLALFIPSFQVCAPSPALRHILQPFSSFKDLTSALPEVGRGRDPEIPSCFPQEEEWFTQRINYRNNQCLPSPAPSSLFGDLPVFRDCVSLLSSAVP